MGYSLATAEPVITTPGICYYPELRAEEKSEAILFTEDASFAGTTKSILTEPEVTYFMTISSEVKGYYPYLTDLLTIFKIQS